MYMFYVDESGTRDVDLGARKEDGSYTKDWLYVVTAVGVFEHRWKGFYRTIVRRKRELLARIRAVHGIELDLDSTEIKSNWVPYSEGTSEASVSTASYLSRILKL